MKSKYIKTAFIAFSLMIAAPSITWACGDGSDISRADNPIVSASAAELLANPATVPAAPKGRIQVGSGSSVSS